MSTVLCLDVSVGGQYAEDTPASGLGLLCRQLLSSVQSEPLAAVGLEDGASVPPVLLQPPDITEDGSRAHCRRGPLSYWVRSVRDPVHV